jgi:hypothetical protein
MSNFDYFIKSVYGFNLSKFMELQSAEVQAEVMDSLNGICSYGDNAFSFFDGDFLIEKLAQKCIDNYAFACGELGNVVDALIVISQAHPHLLFFVDC